MWQLWPGGRGPPPCLFPVFTVLSPILCQQQGEFRAQEAWVREWGHLFLILGLSTLLKVAFGRESHSSLTSDYQTHLGGKILWNW